jgi:copper chaperone CopZ
MTAVSRAAGGCGKVRVSTRQPLARGRLCVHEHRTHPAHRGHDLRELRRAASSARWRACLASSASSVNLATESATVAASSADPATLEAAIEKAGYHVPQRSVRLQIEGMTCASCVTRVERALAQVPGVKSAAVNLATAQALVQRRGATGDDADLCWPRVAPAIPRRHWPRPIAGCARRTAANPCWPVAAGRAAVGAAAAAHAPRTPGRACHAAAGFWQWLLATPVQFCARRALLPRRLEAPCARAPATWTCWWLLGTSAAYALSLVLWWREPDGMPHLYFESAGGGDHPGAAWASGWRRAPSGAPSMHSIAPARAAPRAARVLREGTEHRGAAGRGDGGRLPWSCARASACPPTAGCSRAAAMSTNRCSPARACRWPSGPATR